jgi:hypothetical protein
MEIAAQVLGISCLLYTVVMIRIVLPRYAGNSQQQNRIAAWGSLSSAAILALALALVALAS